MHEYFSGYADLVGTGSDPAWGAGQLRATAIGLAGVVREVFPTSWDDVGWYAKNAAALPMESVQLADASTAEVVCRRMTRETPDGRDGAQPGYLQLFGQGSPQMDLSVMLPGIAARRVGVTLYVDQGWRIHHPETTEFVFLTNEQRRAIVLLLVDVWAFAYAEHSFFDASSPRSQVSYPPLRDRAARAQAKGPRWALHLGWFTYIDRSLYPIDIAAVEWPKHVRAERHRTGVVIQIGDDPREATPALIAQTRRALGLQ